jgi:WhiB family redox-sensing transcriptional regulator
MLYLVLKDTPSLNPTPTLREVAPLDLPGEVGDGASTDGVIDGIARRDIDALLAWTRLANCKGKTKYFFAPVAERPQARARREAKARSLCDGCAVQETCRNYAREHREYGLWGGESEEERHLAGFTLAAPIGLRARHHVEAKRASRATGTRSGVASIATDAERTPSRQSVPA